MPRSYSFLLLTVVATCLANNEPLTTPDLNQWKTNPLANWTVNKPWSLKLVPRSSTCSVSLDYAKSSMPANFTWTATAGQYEYSGVFTSPTPQGTYYSFYLDISCPPLPSPWSGLTQSHSSYQISVSAPFGMTAGPGLPPCNEGFACQTTLANGGTSPYTVNLVSGALPPGLSLKSDAKGAYVGGTPTLQGVYTFQVTASDSAGASGTQTYTLMVGPPGVFYTSATELSFLAITGSAAQSQPLGVATSDLSTVKYTSGSDSAWLTVSPASASTPSSVSVQVDPSKLQPGVIQGHLVFTPDSGKKPVLVTVTATIAQPSPIIAVAPESADLSLAPKTDPMAPAKSYQLGFHTWNAGSGSVTAQVSASSWGDWLSVKPSQVTLAAGQMQALTVTISERTTPGTYQGTISVTASGQTKTIPVVMVVPSPKYVPNLQIAVNGQNGTLFVGSLSPSSEALVYNTVAGTAMDFTAALTGFGSNGSLTATSGHLNALPANQPNWEDYPFELGFNFNLRQLGTGRHEGLLQVTAPGATGSPAAARIGVNVVNEGTGANTYWRSTIDAQIDQPVLVANSSAALSAQLKINNPTNVPVSYAITTPTPGITFDFPTGVLPASGSATVSMKVDPAQAAAAQKWALDLATIAPFVGLNAVVDYHGNIITPGSGGAQARSGSGVVQARQEPRAAQACTPGRLIAAPSKPPSHFQFTADWPVTLGAVVFDDCGSPVADATVTASFSNGDAAVNLPVWNTSKGLYQATWIPGVAASNMSITLRAMKGSLTPAIDQVFGTVVDDPDAPVVFNGGVVNNVNPSLNAPSSPNGIIAIYGKNLASGTVQAQSVPLPRQLGQTTVLIGGIQAPLFMVSAGQINAQVPVELAPGAVYDVVVQNANRFATPKKLRLAKLSPGIVVDLGGRVIAQHLDYSLVNNGAPAKPGEYILLYLTGMGPTTGVVNTGEVSPLDPLAMVSSSFTVTIGGVNAEVYAALLTPNAIGLYQMAVKIPAGLTTGDQPLIVIVEGAAANRATVPVSATP